MVELTKKEKQEIYDNTVICTTTFYRPNSDMDRNREQFAKNFVRNATNLGYKTIVVDGGSTDEFLGEIERYGARIFEEAERGMSPSRRQTIGEGYKTGKKAVAWIEPEKEGYIKELEKTVIPLWTGESDLVVPDARVVVNGRYRIPSYPTSQENEEMYGNDCWRELTGFDLDIWRGPKTWLRERSKEFLRYNGKKHFCKRNGEEEPYGDLWDSIVIPVMKMILEGKQVVGVKVDYVHPKKQTEFEEGNYVVTLKRLNQLTNLVPAFTDYWRKNYPTSKLKNMRENT